MRLSKIACFSIAILTVLAGCSLFGSSGDDNNGNGNGSNGGETTEYSLSASASPTDGGSISPSSGSFEEDTDVEVEATPTEGWAFNNWTGDQESSENPLTFTITEDTDLTANFEDQRSMYAVEMIATNTEDTVDLSLGQADGASQGFDDDLDEEAPPPPPSGALNAYFEINDLDLLQDHRSNIKQQVEWTLNYQVESGDDLKLEWVITDETQADGSLTLTNDSESFEVDMFSETTHTISGTTSGTLIINYSLE